MVTFRLKKAWIPQNNSIIYLLLNEKVPTCKEIYVIGGAQKTHQKRNRTSKEYIVFGTSGNWLYESWKGKP